MATATSRKRRNEINQKSDTSTTTVKELSPEKNTFSCIICNNEFSDREELRKHFLKHGSNEIDYRGRPKPTQKALAKNIHPAAKNTAIQCEWCPEKFPNISQAIQHKHRKHNNVATNYHCEFCGKLFPFRISLIQHQFNCLKQTDVPMMGMPQTTYNCETCSAIFLTMQAKLAHEQKSHFAEYHRTTIVPPPSKKLKRMNDGNFYSIYFCYLCGAEYSMKHNLKTHLEKQHTLEQRTMFPANGIIKCKVCDAIFHTKNAYRVHNLHHKKDDVIIKSEAERMKLVQHVDQDIDITRIVPNPKLPKTISLTYQGKISKIVSQGETSAEKSAKNK
ncbi:zinc finger protein 60-like [Phlebotomus papatasi]|uniref:zinc finger protein 60-like n=1 Tax=Phlebotomus papatasi TaxID=29031 RepID=UPI002483A30D|nr:zinc finger protein 60-like [Phlebotomus papatasi]